MARGRGKAIVYAVAVAAIAIAAGVIATVLLGYSQGQGDYDRVASIAFPGDGDDGGDGFTPDGDDGSTALPGMIVDWDALLAVNPDTVGWVYVPGTPINYPIVHSHDNDEYLYVNFNGEYGNGLQPTYGTPFLMAQNAGDFSDAANIVQAHDMENGTMFAEIPKLGNDEAFNAHRTAYVLTPRRNYRLQSMALVECAANDPIVRTSFNGRDDFAGYLEGLLSRSIVAADPAGPAVEDIGKAVLLSTCTADGTDRRSLLVCAVVEYAEPGGESHGALGEAAADIEAAQEMGEAMDSWL